LGGDGWERKALGWQSGDGLEVHSHLFSLSWLQVNGQALRQISVSLHQQFVPTGVHSRLSLNSGDVGLLGQSDQGGFG
jgi:hypothetical protein